MTQRERDAARTVAQQQNAHQTYERLARRHALRTRDAAARQRAAEYWERYHSILETGC